MFSGYTVQADIKGSKLGRGNQEVFTLAGKNTEIVLVPCLTWECVFTASSGGMDISEVPGCHLLQQTSSQ